MPSITSSAQPPSPMSGVSCSAAYARGVVFGPLRAMDISMLAVIDNHQIVNAVIRNIAVDMVHHLVSIQHAAKVRLHDVAMLVNSSACFGMHNVLVSSRMKFSLRPIGVPAFFVAFAAAILTIASIYMGGARIKIAAALQAMAQKRRELGRHSFLRNVSDLFLVLYHSCGRYAILRDGA